MTSYDRYRCLSVERRGKVLVIWFDRPDALNAIDAELHRELSQIFADVGGDREAQAVVLTGKGRAFSAGGDLRWFQHATRDELDALFAEARKIIVDFLEVEQPIIAAVNGPATGLGATLALFSDVIFASGEARIGDPHVRIGVVAGDGGAIIWPRSRRRDFINVRVVTDPHGGPAEWAKRKGPPVRRTEPTRANPLAAEIVRGTQTHRGNGILAYNRGDRWVQKHTAQEGSYRRKRKSRFRYNVNVPDSARHNAIGGTPRWLGEGARHRGGRRFAFPAHNANDVGRSRAASPHKCGEYAERKPDSRDRSK